MPKGEPTYLIVNSNGTITAVFTGGVQMTENNTSTVSGGGSLSWINSGTIYESITGFFNAGIGHRLALLAQGDTNDLAGLNLTSQTAGAAGTSSVVAYAEDSVTLVSEVATLIDSLGRSNYPQLEAGLYSLKICRGIVSSAAGIVAGEGFTVARTAGGFATGDYTVTFTNPFLTEPSVIANQTAVGDAIAVPTGMAAGSVRILIATQNGANALIFNNGDAAFNFMAIG